MVQRMMTRNKPLVFFPVIPRRKGSIVVAAMVAKEKWAIQRP